uniref:Uncharacterized protein n=1 Tax=Romanomermis culicivorax TaxID=13658 RepID=A0A915JZY0_ROMCU
MEMATSIGTRGWVKNLAGLRTRGLDEASVLREKCCIMAGELSAVFHCTRLQCTHLPILPNNSTPSAAKMKNSRKNNNPRFPTCGKACATVSNRDRIPLAIFNLNISFSKASLHLWKFSTTTPTNIFKTKNPTNSKKLMK